MVLISLVVMIVTVFNFELRCLYSKPVYRNYDEKFRNIAVTSDFVYIGGNSKIIKLDSSLIQLDQTYVSMEGRNSIYDENWLLTTDNNASLIVCNYDSKYNTLCLKLKLDFSVVTSSSELHINKPSTKYLATTFKQSNVLIIASSMCLWYVTQSNQCYAISGYLVHDRFHLYEHANLGFHYAVEYLQQAKHVAFKAILKTEKFIYFLFNTEDGYSKLGKMCIDSFDTKTNTFQDTPILCSYGGNNYTLAHDAVYWEEYLFVAFSDDLLNVICKYKFRNISETFMESRQDRLKCPYVTANKYFSKQTLQGWCFDKTSGLCENGFRNYSCPELNDVDDGFCNTLIFGSVEGSLPITDDKIVYSDEITKVGSIVKLGILTFSTHSLIFAGTTTGKIGKIYVDENRSKQLETFNIVQHSFPVLDIKVQNQKVYVMTENTVINMADDEPCPSDVTCIECMTSENPACGWDIHAASCMFNPDRTSWWLPSIGRQCLQVKTNELVINETTDNDHLEDILVRLLFDPDIFFYNAICRNKLGDGRIMNLNGYYECLMLVGDEPFQLNVTTNLKEVTIASTTVNVIKCSAFKSCGACVKTTYCFWCLGSVSCVKQAATCNFTVNISMTEDQCPRITSTEVLIQSSNTTVLTENLKINVDNLYRYGNDTEKLTCVVGNVQYAVVVDDSYTVVVCQNVNAPRLNNSKLYLEYNGSRLDNAADVEVYECNDFSSSCGVCKYHVNQGYKCDWCGLCKTTIAGAPERCQKDKLMQCQLSVSEVYPSAGPEFGGTIVNITGTNIGNRGDTISVTINGVKCENVTVIKPSTVISCITCNGSASTQDGTEVTVNGVISPLATHKYTFQSELELSTFSPSSSIVSGGRKISIQGTKIGFTGSRYNVLFCNNIKCIHCRFIQIEDDNTLTCNMEGSGSFITLTYLTVTIDGNTHLRLNNNFVIVADPLVNPLSVDSSSVFRSGGVKLTITGTGFSNVGVVIIDTPDAVPCTILSDNSVICKSPPYVKSDFERRKRAAIQNIYVNFDDYRVSLGVFYVDDPLFEKLSKVFIYISNAVIEIKGHGLLQGARPDDYLIRVGLDGLCIIIEINNYNITCLPPGTKPRTNTGDLVFIVVVVGNINEHVGYLRYESATSETNNVVLYGVAGGGIVGVLVIISVVVIMMRRSMKKKIDKTKTEMNEMKEEIRKIVVKEDGLSAGIANSRYGRV